MFSVLTAKIECTVSLSTTCNRWMPADLDSRMFELSVFPDKTIATCVLRLTTWLYFVDHMCHKNVEMLYTFSMTTTTSFDHAQGVHQQKATGASEVLSDKRIPPALHQLMNQIYTIFHISTS